MEQLQLENLASDCLIDILILLDIKDLTSIADCSRNFRSLARRAFSLKYRNVFNMDENTTPRALRKFGDLIRFIRMKEYYILDEKKVLLISECAPNLVAMRFNQYDWFLWEKLVPQLKFILMRLVTSTIQHFELLKNHSNLQVLSLTNIDDEEMRALKVPSVKYVSLEGHIFYVSSLTEFMRSNRHLLGLELWMDFGYATLINTTCGFKYLTSLRELVLSGTHCDYPEGIVEMMFDTIYNELSDIGSLRSFAIFHSFYYTDSFWKIKKLRRLEIGPQWLDPVEYRAFLKNISLHMVHMKYLYLDALVASENDSELKLIEDIPGLKEIKLEKIVQKYAALVKICKRQNRKLRIRSNVLKFEIRSLGEHYWHNRDTVSIVEDFKSILHCYSYNNYYYELRLSLGCYDIDEWTEHSDSGWKTK